jgi:hypothetical protein
LEPQEPAVSIKKSVFRGRVALAEALGPIAPRLVQRVLREAPGLTAACAPRIDHPAGLERLRHAVVR